MANTFINKRRFKIAASAAAGSDQYTGSQNFVLNNGSDEFVSTIMVHIVDTGALSATITVNARPHRP